MASHVNELRVFIASPSDLVEERAALRSLEADLNSQFSAADLRVRLTGWEERPPAYGRPQAQINPMVDECDVFIGLLRRKWGSPTGTHDSGFGEEFERALERRQTSGAAPEISLFFAQLSKDEVDDPGPELIRVLAFQERVRAERIGIYSKFSGPVDLSKQVQDLLHRHLIDLVVARTSVENPAGPEVMPGDAVEPASTHVEDLSTDDQLDDARRQLSSVIAGLQKLLTNPDSERPLDRDRLELIGKALSRDGSDLGAHLANRLYQRRDELELIGAEHVVWVRTLLTDVSRAVESADRVIPGWAIFNPKADAFGPMVLSFAMESGAVGVGAVRSMQRLGMRPPELWPPELQHKVSAERKDPGEEVRLDNWTNLLNRHKGRSACMTYLTQDLDTDDPALAQHLDRFLGAIESERGDLNDESRQLIANARTALAGDPSPLAKALGYSSEEKALWRLVFRHIEKLNVKRLNQLASQKFNRAARLVSVRTGVAMDTLTEGTIRKLLFEDDSEVLQVFLDAAESDPEIARHYLALLKDREEGKSAPDSLEALLLARSAAPSDLRQRDIEEKLDNVYWEALTHLDPDGAAPEARVALQTDVSELRSRVLAWIGEEHENLVNFLAEDRKRIAASLLARRGSRSTADVELVLAWFEERAASGFVQDFAFAALENVADESTLARITEILTRHRDSTGIRLAFDRLRGPLAPAIATVFMNDETDAFRVPSMVWHVTQAQRSNDELRDALYDKSDKVRASAAGILASRLSDHDIAALLETYPNAANSYWYNVIAILDEYLYARSVEVV